MHCSGNVNLKYRKKVPKTAKNGRFREKVLFQNDDLYYTGTVVRKKGIVFGGRTMENQVMEETLLQSVVKNIPLGLIVSREGRQRKVYYVNQTAHEAMGYSKEEYIALVEKGWAHFMDVNMREIIRENHEKIRTGEPFEVLAKAETKNGEEKWLLHRIVVRMEEGPLCYLSYMDVTDKVEQEHLRIREQEVLREQASRDSFTKLYNRGTMEQLVGKALSTARQSQCAYIALDVDNFKCINDVYGHDMGDLLIMEVSKLLKREFKHKASVARMGGDEFAVFVRDIEKREDVYAKAERVLAELREMKGDMGLKIAPTLSIGIAFAPEAGENFSELYHRADTALYRVKNEEKNGVAVYEIS